ncbi:glycosyltransferase [Candidatus Gracilibacteria bacterium]|nr:glycosyltransferase [Candidatus Gracilibacteria bacterium]
MNPSQFSIIIPSCNEGHWLRDTVLGVLENTDYPDFEIVVVSDGSTDSSADFLKKENLPNARLIELTKSVGAAQARNIGGREAKGDLIVFLDAHMKPMQEDWLHELSQQLQNKKIGASSLSIPHLEDVKAIAYIYTIKDLALEPTWITPSDKTKPLLVPAISGACFAMRREVFVVTGGFDEGLQKWGREDTEYSLRLWRLGYDLITSPCSAIGHSWERKRNFEISWEQVDYNILRTALTLISPQWQKDIVAYLKSKRSQNVLKVLRSLEEDALFQKRKQELQKNFVRSFDEYIQEFEKILPILKS